jgi:hypothetical protein
MSTPGTSPLSNFDRGDVVTLVDTNFFGTIIELKSRYGHRGARVLWTSTGEIAWTPLRCIESGEILIDEPLVTEV